MVSGRWKNWMTVIHQKSGRQAPAFQELTICRDQVGSSSLKVRVPEMMVETIDCRDMMSSRMAA